MRKWYDPKSCRAAERHAKAAAVPPTVDTNSRQARGGGKRREGKERGDGGDGGATQEAHEVCVWPSSS